MKNVKKMTWKRVLAGTLAVLMFMGGMPTNSEKVSAAQNVSERQGEYEKQNITGFFAISQEEWNISIGKKVSLKVLTARMPATIDVYLDGSDEVTSIPVTWECEGDYENSNYYYYQFNPKWDESKYALEAAVANEVPYVGVFLGRDTSLKMASTTENQKKVYQFMKKEMGFNTAAACGVLANIKCESSFNPLASCIDTNGLTSFGICQWNGSRYEALQNYCNLNGYDYKTIDGQLEYLKYELEGSESNACKLVKNVKNTSDGAYTAGYNWARYFERCASVYYESRAKLARDTYWPMYGNSDSDEPVKETYSITYELDGGENSGKNPDSYDETSSDITLYAPTKEGYTFVAWYKNSAMTKKITTIPKGSTGNLCLYAKWKANTYTIKFKGNGETSGSMSDMKDCEYDSIYTLTKNKYKRKGYQFTGWSTKKKGGGSKYENKADVQNLSAENGAVITLYAQWEKQVYTIDYQLNGGEVLDGNPTEYEIDTKTFTLEKAVKKGYTFEGWYKEASYKNKVTKIKKGSTGNLILYAKWKRNKYKIVYKGNGATSGSMSDVKVCKYGKTYTLAKNKFKRKGYVFLGWNTAADGSGKSYANQEVVKNLSSRNNKTITLYAQWERESYQITYELNGGTMTTSNPTKYYDTTKTFTLNAPERLGYTFLGWYTEPEFQNKITKIKKGTKKNYTLYAKWEANQYEIQFDGNGATGGSTQSMVGCIYDQDYILIENSYERAGYQFVGWNTMPDGSGAYYRNQAQVKNLTAEKNGKATLYAQWEQE